jgi:peptide/nickel transport system substrate-binding protein
MTISRRGLGQGVAAAAGGLALSGIGAGPVMAQRSANTLRVAFRDAVPNIDPYFNSQRTGIIIAHQAMDGLVHRDPDTFKNVPALATEWAWQGNNAIDFKIRPGVKFHDGSDFGPDDVVYTFNTIAELGGRLSTPGNYAWIEGA